MIEAASAVRSSPEDETAWDSLEEMADDGDHAHYVGQVHRQVLTSALEPEVFEAVARRALGFHEEWFADQGEDLASLTALILDADASAHWAFDQMAMDLTAREDWDTLLDAYDRRIAKTEDAELSKRMLIDAAEVAKDFAAQPHRAADYLRRQLAADPRDHRLAQSVERLLVRQNRWPELIELWRLRLPELDAKAARETRLEIAGCQLRDMQDAAAAIDELRTLLSLNPGDDGACAMLEEILAAHVDQASMRSELLQMLTANYELSGQSDRVVALLEKTIESVQEAEAVALHREAAELLAGLGRDADAAGHCGALMSADPDDQLARLQFRNLAERSGLHAEYAESLSRSAEAAQRIELASELRIEAAKLHAQQLGAPQRAAEILVPLMAEDQLDAALRLRVAYRVESLGATLDAQRMRLAALTRIGELESSALLRRSALIEGAAAARHIDDFEIALELLERVLSEQADHSGAHQEKIEILRALERWEALVPALSARAQSRTSVEHKQSDLLDAARIQARELQNPKAAIATLLALIDAHGVDDRLLDDLSTYMRECEQWDELAALLGRHAFHHHRGTAARLAQLADVLNHQLGRPTEASDYYIVSLRIDPSCNKSRLGLIALIDQPECAERAVTALEQAYEQGDEWQQYLGILEPALASDISDAHKVEMLLSAAQTYELRIEQPHTALELLCRALPLAPDSVRIADDIARLADACERWDLPAPAHEAAARKEDLGSRQRTFQWRRAGEMYENQLGDATRALAAYHEASIADPDDCELLEKVSSLACRLPNWPIAVSSALALSVRSRSPDEMADELEASATEHDAWPAMLPQVRDRLELAHDMARSLRYCWHSRLARWAVAHDEFAHLALNAAHTALELAEDSALLEAERILAKVQRKTPSDQLLDTLLRIDELMEGDVEVQREAAALSLALPVKNQQRPCLERLFAQASQKWRSTLNGEQREAFAGHTRWALDRLLALLSSAGDGMAIAELCESAVSLPFTSEQRRDYALRAAQIWSGADEYARAIDILQPFASSPLAELPVIELAAELCQKADRIPELLFLRGRELALATSDGQRLALRLAISQLYAQLEAGGGRLAALETNLEQCPGHTATLAAITEIQRERARFGPLADLLESQATALTVLGRDRDALEIWQQLAVICEKDLGDPARAISVLEKVAHIHPEPQSHDALARLSAELGDARACAQWLTKRVENAAEGELVGLLDRLARAHMNAGQPAQALTALRRAFDASPGSVIIGRKLADLQRSEGDARGLLETFNRSAQHVDDAETLAERAREAVDICRQLGESSVLAAPVLSRALALGVSDRDIQLAWAESLRHEERHDEAKVVLQTLIESYGRKRAKDRVSAHLQLAEVYHAEGETQRAIKELETATSADRSHALAYRRLAELAWASEDWERAERAYRTLLMQARSQRAKDASLAREVASIQFRLSELAEKLDNASRAEELRETSLESALKHPELSDPLEAVLRTGHEHSLLQKLLAMRLEQSESPRVKASILADLAQLYEGPLEQPREAFDARMQALSYDPGLPAHHDALWTQVTTDDTINAYESKLDALIESSAKSGEMLDQCELLLRSARVKAEFRDDVEAARAQLAVAEALGVREADVWRSALFVAEKSRDTAEQDRLLQKLSERGLERSEDRSDVLFRLAEIRLVRPESLEEGVKSLQQAFDESHNAARATAICMDAAESIGHDAAFVALFEKLARETGDAAAIARALDLRARAPDCSLELIREAAELAHAREDHAREHALLERALERGGADSLGDSHPEMIWALESLAKNSMTTGDRPDAVHWFLRAAESGEVAKIWDFGCEIARSAAEDGDTASATALYDKLWSLDPANASVWQPLIALHLERRDFEQLARIGEETLPFIERSETRTEMRLTIARGLLTSPDHHDRAVQLLEAVTMEAPDEQAAYELLISHYEHHSDGAAIERTWQAVLHHSQSEADEAGILRATRALGQLADARDPRDALALYRDASESMPHNLELLQLTLDAAERVFADRLAEMDSEHEADEDNPEPDAELEDEHRTHALERAELLARMCRLEELPGVVDRALACAELFESLEQPSQALDVLRGCFERFPNAERLWRELRAACERHDQLDTLCTVIVQSAEQRENPHEKAELYRAAAKVSEEGGDSEQRLRYLGLALAAHPDDLDSAQALVQLHCERQTFADAVEVIDTQLALATEDDEQAATRLGWMVRKAEILAETGDYERAIGELESAFELDPERVRPALCTLLAQQFEESRVAERSDAIFGRLFELYRQSERHDENCQLCQRWLDLDRARVDILETIRSYAGELEQWDLSLRCCERLLDTCELADNAHAQLETLEELYRAHTALSSVDQMRARLEAAYETHPESAWLADALEQLYTSSGEHTVLAALLHARAEAASDEEASARLFRKAGRLFQEAEDLDRAAAAYGRAYATNPDDVELARWLATHHIRSERPSEAEEVLDEAMERLGAKRSPALGQLQYLKSRAVAAQGQIEARLEWLQKALATDRNQPRVIAEIADVAEAMEDWNLATRMLRELAKGNLENAPVSAAEACRRQAEIWSKLGDEMKANFWNHKASQLAA